MFEAAVKDDNSLLDFFGMIMNGMSDKFIDNNSERFQLRSFKLRLDSIQEDVKRIKEMSYKVVDLVRKEGREEGDEGSGVGGRVMVDLSKRMDEPQTLNEETRKELLLRSMLFEANDGYEMRKADDFPLSQSANQVDFDRNLIVSRDELCDSLLKRVQSVERKVESFQSRVKEKEGLIR